MRRYASSLTALAQQIALLSERLLLVNWTAPVALAELADSDLEIWPTHELAKAHLEFARARRRY
jgi:hypothetical protein